MALPTITESSNRQPSAQEIDELNQSRAIEARLAEQRALSSQNSRETARETAPNREQAPEYATAEEQETSLGSKKAEQNKPSAADQMKDVAVDLAKKQIKRSIFAALLPWLPWIIGIPLITFMICFIGFAMASVYTCAQQKGWSGLIWDQIFKDGFTTLLKESFDGTCGLLKNTAPKTVTETPKTPESSNTGANSATAEELDLLLPDSGPEPD